MVTNPVVQLDKQLAVGGNGGWSFDSGCNFSRLSKIHIYFGPYHHKSVDYPSTIHRIFLEFDNSNGKPEPSIPSLDKTRGTHGVFLLPENDSIASAKVWADCNLVNAVQFIMESGAISQLYGSPCNTRITPVTTFQARDPYLKLVGIHGSYGAVIDKLGFTYAKVASATQDKDDISSTEKSEWDEKVVAVLVPSIKEEES